MVNTIQYPPHTARRWAEIVKLNQGGHQHRESINNHQSTIFRLSRRWRALFIVLNPWNYGSHPEALSPRDSQAHCQGSCEPKCEQECRYSGEWWPSLLHSIHYRLMVTDFLFPIDISGLHAFYAGVSRTHPSNATQGSNVSSSMGQGTTKRKGIICWEGIRIQIDARVVDSFAEGRREAIIRKQCPESDRGKSSIPDPPVSRRQGSIWKTAVLTLHLLSFLEDAAKV